MSEWQGRPFAFLALTLCLWAGSRLVQTSQSVAGSPIAKSPAANTKAASQFPRATPDFLAGSASPSGPASILEIAAKHRQTPLSRRPFQIPHSTHFGLPPALVPWQDGGRPFGLPAPLRVAEDGKPQNTGRDTPPTNVLAILGRAGQPIQAMQKDHVQRGTIYAYSFWRTTSDTGPVLATGAQYGGSQSGIIGTFDPFGDPARGPTFLLRGSATPDGREKEAALGMRWKPRSSLPVTISAERRFRTRASDRFAAYLAGGVDEVPLFGKLTFNGFGQIGYASGKDGGGFFDAQARAMHPIFAIGDIPFSAGVGGWAGGQRGAKRLDTGPTMAARLNLGKVDVLLQLDWRKRIAGNAMPKDGLALTLSTGF